MTTDDRIAGRGSRWVPWVVALLMVVAAVSAAAFVASRRAPRPPEPVTAMNAVGDSTCLSCHTDKASYESTAHRRTSRHPSPATMPPGFRDGENILRTANPNLYFRMTSNASGYYETAVTRTGHDTTARTERIAYVTGSGRKGQSFLYWNRDALFQLPVSYWTSLHVWINSPGYSDGVANFNRPIAPRCLECHATWIQSVPAVAEANLYDSTTFILGITCERCHASGREHVARERSVLHAVRDPSVVNVARMSRAQKMDACAQCHGGVGRPIGASFRFVAGMPLEKFVAHPRIPAEATVDVHGNQVALLQRSKCFQSSQMTCLTCHNVHGTQRNTAEISGRCLSCHTEQSCGLYPKQGHALAGRCVDCHMPEQMSSIIVVSHEGKEERAPVRSHWIKVYQDSLNSGHASRVGVLQ